MVRVLDLHLCDSGSNPTIGSYFFFFSLFFFFFFACHECKNVNEKLSTAHIITDHDFWVSHAELILEKLATMTMETSKGWKKEKIYKIIHENHLVWRCRPFLYMRRGGNARLRAI